ncbi:hypothetical protein H5410_014513 [Solanum commersonii]|uniref:Uncharacterized protein n=1 Tax=Solanum commersonii TaxID=4109 RepID=A0A9J5ZR52_SOLCO|nr:hypothetical protein H5410_014513 [Solanum commersonii]
MLPALGLAMLQGSSMPTLQSPLLNQPQFSVKTNKQPHLMRPLARSQYQHHYLADTVKEAQSDDPIILGHTDTIPVSSSQAASRTPSSSRSATLSRVVVVPMARVQKLEA